MVILLLAMAALPLTGSAAGMEEDPITPGSSVLVVYNSSMEASRRIAEHYASLRGVPESQVVGFEMPQREEISRGEYQQLIEEPLSTFLVEKDLMVTRRDPDYNYSQSIASSFFLAGKYRIRYLLLCHGVPLKIRNESSIDEKEEANLFFPGMRKNEASVDSELAALPMRAITSLRTGIIENPNFGIGDRSRLHPCRGVLMVTRLDGPDAGTAGQLVDKAIQAEKTGLWGRVYLDTRSLKSGSYVMGDQWISAAGKASRSFGFEVEEEDSAALFPSGYPMGKAMLYLGWYSGRVAGAFRDGHVEFVPGAIACHIHSYSASTLRSATENWVGPLLAMGATASLGCVYEPYLEFTPNLAVFWDKLLDGFTLAEAAYASMNALSWQTVVVGDPLYRPFGKSTEQRHEELMRISSPLAGWSLMTLVQRSLLESRENPRAEEWLQALEEHPDYRKVLQISPALNHRVSRLLPSGLETDRVLRHYEKAILLSDSEPERLRMLLAYANVHRSFGTPVGAIQSLRYILETWTVLEDRSQLLDWLTALVDDHGSREDVLALKAIRERNK